MYVVFRLNGSRITVTRWLSEARAIVKRIPGGFFLEIS